MDLFIPNGSRKVRTSYRDTPDAVEPWRFYINDAGRFVESAKKVGLAVAAWGIGCAVGDADGDGFDDLFVTTAAGPNLLFHNRSDGTFENWTERSGVGSETLSSSAAFGDLDRDGDLDLVVTTYVDESRDPEEECTWKGAPVMCGPKSYEPLDDLLYLNDGHGHFETSDALGFDLPGQFAGFLGGGLDPYVAGDPSLPGYTAPRFRLREEVPSSRFARMRNLRRAIVDRLLGDLGNHEAVGQLETHYRRAFELLGSPKAREAFDLSREKPEVRERYGFDREADRSKLAREFGGLPHLGQSMLLARRLIEAGVRLVTVCAGRRLCQAWDTHRKHFPLMKRSLLPMTNRAFSALLDDMGRRGLLDETLVVAMGEFGRTPKVGQVTSDAGADKGGRDHWPFCYTVLFAGAGVRGGYVYGESDRYAAYPIDKPVGPEDIAATIYWALGLDPSLEIHDHFGRPHSLAKGEPITEIFA